MKIESKSIGEGVLDLFILHHHLWMQKRRKNGLYRVINYWSESPRVIMTFVEKCHNSTTWKVKKCLKITIVSQEWVWGEVGHDLFILRSVYFSRWTLYTNFVKKIWSFFLLNFQRDKTILKSLEKFGSTGKT